MAVGYRSVAERKDLEKHLHILILRLREVLQKPLVVEGRHLVCMGKELPVEYSRNLVGRNGRHGGGGVEAEHLPADRASRKLHLVLRERARLVGEEVLDHPEHVAERGRAGKRRGVGFLVVHVEVA